jgi:hypothetical protein
MESSGRARDHFFQNDPRHPLDSGGYWAMRMSWIGRAISVDARSIVNDHPARAVTQPTGVFPRTSE